MSLVRSLLSSQTNSLLRIHYPLSKSQHFPSFFTRTLNSSSQIDPDTRNEIASNKKPLGILFQEAVGLREKGDTSDSESEEQTENSDVKRKLRELEREIRVLKAKSGNRKEEDKVEREESGPARRLSGLFGANEEKIVTNRSVKVEDPRVRKEVYTPLSPNAESFFRRLYDEGYLKNANFLRNGKFVLGDLDSDYSRDFLSTATDEFSKNHQEIAEWLCSSNLKQIILFGCPSLIKRSVFAAKRLRKFYKIEEKTVCSKCALKSSCKFANKPVWGVGDGKLSLSDVMTVTILYALDKAHPRLTIPVNIKDSVDLLLKEVVELSRTPTSISEREN